MKLAHETPVTIHELQRRIVALNEMQRRLDWVGDDEFMRGGALKIKEIAVDADPFSRKRLLKLAEDYERRLAQPAQPRDSLA